MSKSTLTKIAAVVCSAASLSVLALSASAATEVSEDTYKASLTAGKTNIVAGQITAKAGEEIDFPVYIFNNTGYAATGLRLYLPIDKGFAPVFKDEKQTKLTISKKGDAVDDAAPTFSYNSENGIIGCGTTSSDGESDSGLMYSVKIKVPADAKPGDKFEMKLEVERWLDTAAKPVDNVTVNGFVTIEGETTATTTATTTTETVTTTTSTVTTLGSTTTTTTSTSGVTTTTTTTTTHATTSSTKAATTTAKGGSSSSTTATKTGDAGVGVAVAGLLIAAGTAVVATKKKKED